MLQASRLNWICRVPGTLDAVKDLLEKVKQADLTELEEEGYSSACYTIDYGQVSQHWVVYHSRSAADRETKTLQRRLEKEAEQARKSLKKLAAQVFHCREDAQQATVQWQQQWSWHCLDKIQIKKDKKYDLPGRPKSSSSGTVQYSIEAQVQVDQA